MRSHYFSAYSPSELQTLIDDFLQTLGASDEVVTMATLNFSEDNTPEFAAYIIVKSS